MIANKIVYTWGLENSTSLTNQYEVRNMETEIFGGNILIRKRFNLLVAENFNMGFDIFKTQIFN